jgi:glycosyltransferase involved in cell wall biosynthesis
MKPLLTVICLCYNQEKYIEQAIRSVFQQTKVPFECIIVDDCSTDNSQVVIRELATEFHFKKVILHSDNKGNCRSFNEALQFAEGKYIIDLAGDDYFLGGAFQEQIVFFESQSEEVGMVFSNAELVNEKGTFIKHHFEVNNKKQSIQNVPSGKIFADVLARYFICVPTMVMRKTWLLELSGYNEALSYEDFDLWVRGSLFSEFIYLDKVLVVKREHQGSLSKAMFSSENKEYYYSTLQICQFAFKSICSADEKEALINRIKYEGRNASYFQADQAVAGFKYLLRELQSWSLYLTFKWRFFSSIGKIFSLFR